MIQPEWHGWMHHVFDETPDEVTKALEDVTVCALESNAIYTHHVGHTDYKATDQVDLTQYRQRGYKVGSLMIGPNDPDQYYLQPGHPLSPLSEKGRFKTRKETTTVSEALEEEKDKK